MTGRFSAAFLLTWAALAGQAMSQPPNAPQPLRIQRALVPKSARSEWSGEQGRYLPIDADRFERWLAARLAGSSVATLDTRIRAADYEARLDDQGRLVGSSRWEVEHTGPDPAILPLAPHEGQFSRAFWRSPAGDAAAEVGLTGELRPGALVEASGVLETAWRLEPATTSDSDRRYRVRLAECVQNRLTLALPEALKVGVDRGLAERDGVPQQGLQRWTIRPDSRLEVEIRVAWPEGQATDAPRLAVRQSAEYRLAPDGLTLETTFERVAQRWPEAVTAVLPRGVRLLEATRSGAALPWERAAVDGQGERIAITLPAEVGGSGPLQLVCRAEFVAGQPLVLPNLQLDDVLWEEGTARIVAAMPLRVTRLGLSRARQTALDPDGAIHVQLFETSAAITVVASTPENPTPLLRGVSLVAEGARLTGVLLAELAGPRGDAPSLEAGLSPAWTIDAVEADPLGALENWKQQDDRLVVRLAALADDRRPARLTIRGHRSLEPNLQLSAADLRMLEFRNSIARRDLVSLRAAEPLRIRTRYEQDLTLVAPEDLDLESARLLAEPPQGLCFAFDHSAERLRVSFLPGTPEFAAELGATVNRTGDGWSEEFQVRIAPANRPLEEVLIRLSEPRPDLAWRLGDAKSPQRVLAQPLSPTDLAERGLPERDHVYRLSLPAAQPGAFELFGRAEHPTRASLQVALPAMVGAGSQVSRVAVSAANPCEVEASSPLERFFREPAAGGQPWSTAFRYDASLPSEALQLSVAATTDNAVPRGLWAWREVAETRVSANGARLHTITHFLENRGTEVLQFAWPSELKLYSVRLDEIAYPLAADPPVNGLSLRLTPGKRFPTLRCEFEESGALLGVALRLHAPRLKTPYHVATRSWRLGLPARYAAWSPRGALRAAWSERLLGPLANTTRTEPWPAWWLAPGPSWLGALGAAAPEADLFEALATASITLAKTERPTWGQWFAAWQASLIQSGVELLVDRSAAARMGVDPREVAPRWSSRPTREEVERLLADAGWTVRYSGDAVVLTDGDAAQFLDESSAARSESVLPAIAWRTGEGCTPSPWRVPPAPRYASPDASPLLAIGDDWAVVARSEACWALFALAALGLAAATIVTYRFRPRFALALGAACLLIAATVPAAWAIIAAALPVGWMSGSALHAIGGFCRKCQGVAALPGVIAVSAFAALGAAGAYAVPASAPVYRVLIPVDDQRIPQGGECFVPLELLAAIEADERAALWPGGSPVLWTSVDYRLDLSHGGPPRLQVVCELHSLARDCRFLWPGSDPRWELVDIRLDGRNGPTADRERAALFLAEPGRHRAEFAFRAVEGLQPPGQLEFDFPPQPSARVSLTAGAGPSDASVVLLEPAPAAGGRPGTFGSVEALGARRLRVAVQGSATAAALAPQRELYWLHVRPDYVTIDARLPLTEGSPAPLVLRSDQSLQITAGNVASPASETAGYRLELPTSSARDGVLRTTLLAPMSGVGRVSWPNLQGPTNAGRWLAISIDPSLAWTLPPPDQTRAVAPPEFLAQWGEAGARPVAVVELPSTPLAWSIETSPRAATTRGRVVADCDLALRRARVVVTADLDTTTGYVLSHVVDLPAGFLLESAAVSQEGNDRLAYAARDGQALSLFLTSPVAGPHRVRIEGSLPVAESGELAFVPVTLANVASEPFELRLFRRVSALAELSHVRDAVRQELASARTDDPGRRPLASLTATSPTFEARVRVAANEPELVAAQLLRRSQGEESAGYDVDVVVQVAGGRADALRFRLPTGWIRPRIEAPGAAVDWLEGPAGETLLSLRFRTPLVETYRFRALDWRPTLPDDARLPYLASLDDEHWQRFFANPAPTVSPGEDRAAQGLAAAQLPPSLASLLPERTLVWRVTSLEANWRADAAERRSAPVVELADYAAYVDAAGGALLSAAYDLLPAGAPEVTLRLAEGDALLGLDVEGQPVFAREAAPGQWLVQLPSSELPQRLEAVVLRPPGAARGALEAPRLSVGSGPGLPVAKTLWMVGDERWQEVSPDAAPAVDLELQRLYSTRDLLTAAVAQSAGRDASVWLRSWLARWSEAARFACAQLGGAGPSGAVDQAALLRRATARQQQEVVQAAGERGWPPLAGAAPERQNPVRSFWAGLGRPVYRSSRSGDQPALALPVPRSVQSLLGRATLGAALALAAVALGVAAARSRGVAPGAPPWAWAALGVFWWAYCVAPWLGLLLAAWAAWQAAPRSWRVPTLPPR